MVKTVGDGGYICFQYMQIDRDTEEATKMDYKVRLTSTLCYYGGKRLWFICPLVVNGQACKKRVGSLYLEGTRFGCRHCYDLTYTTSQESYRYDRLFRDIGFTIQEVRFSTIYYGQLGSDLESRICLTSHSI